MRQVPGRWLSVMVCAAIFLLLVAAPTARADDLNRDLLRKGMSLNDVILAFGQPNHLEWVNVKGTPVLFLFYPTDKSDAVFRKDGSMWLPLGFITESLAGWGKDFYEESKFLKDSTEPNVPGDR